MLTFFRAKTNPEQVAAERLYAALAAQSRQPVFYADLGVPDSVDGRFDMILLHSFIVMRRLGREGKAARSLSQAIYDVMFVDMDRAVREMGIGDLSVKKHIRRMMKAFNGRVAAYESGLDDVAKLHEALRRNLYGTVKDQVPGDTLKAMADYIVSSVQHFDSTDLALLMDGQVSWAELPGNAIRKSA
ncbi:MAG: ubiquinol-cytochrome C chaperone family protein [Micavibrio sp.]